MVSEHKDQEEERSLTIEFQKYDELMVALILKI